MPWLPKKSQWDSVPPWVNYTHGFVTWVNESLLFPVMQTLEDFNIRLIETHCVCGQCEERKQRRLNLT